MSNKKIDALMEEFKRTGEVVSLTVNPPLTYMVIRIGGVYGIGRMVCMPGDAFDKEFGVRNALRKALKHIHEQRKHTPMLRDGNPLKLCDWWNTDHRYALRSA